MNSIDDHAVETTTLLVKAGSYFGAAFSVGAALTLTQWGILVGMFTAIVTVTVNVVFQYRRDKRETLQHNVVIAEHEKRMALFMQQGSHITPEKQHED